MWKLVEVKNILAYLVREKLPKDPLPNTVLQVKISPNLNLYFKSNYMGYWNEEKYIEKICDLDLTKL